MTVFTEVGRERESTDLFDQKPSHTNQVHSASSSSSNPILHNTDCIITATIINIFPHTYYKYIHSTTNSNFINHLLSSLFSLSFNLRRNKEYNTPNGRRRRSCSACRHRYVGCSTASRTPSAPAGHGDRQYSGHAQPRWQVHPIQHIWEHIRSHRQIQATHHAHRERRIRHRLVFTYPFFLFISFISLQIESHP